MTVKRDEEPIQLINGSGRDGTQPLAAHLVALLLADHASRASPVFFSSPSALSTRS